MMIKGLSYIFGICKTAYGVIKKYLPSKSSKPSEDNSIGKNNSKNKHKYNKKVHVTNKPKRNTRRKDVNKSKHVDKSHDNDNSHGNDNSHDEDKSHDNDNSHDDDKSHDNDNSHGNVTNVYKAPVSNFYVNESGSAKESAKKSLLAGYDRGYTSRSFSTNSLRKVKNYVGHNSGNGVSDINKQNPQNINSEADPEAYQKYRTTSISNDKAEADVNSEQVNTVNNSLSGKASYALEMAKIKAADKAANNSQATNSFKGRRSHTHINHSKLSKDMPNATHKLSFNGPFHFSASGHYPNEIKRPAGYGKQDYRSYSPTPKSRYGYMKDYRSHKPYSGKTKKEIYKLKRKNEYKDPDAISALFRKAFKNQKSSGNKELHYTYGQPEGIPLSKYVMGRTANGHSIITTIDRGNEANSLASKQKGPNSSGPDL